MKRISLRLLLALLTFVIGISLTAFLMFRSEIPDVPVPQSQKTHDSHFILETQISKESKRFWNKEVLRRFKEAPLETSSDATNESYRFVLVPTFDNPVSIRLWSSADKKVLVIKKTNGQGGFGIKKIGKLSFEKTRVLTEEEWVNFIRLLDQAFFWDLPSIDNNDLPEPDGATWIIEGNSNSIYHEVHRITPNKELRESCTYLLKLAGLEKEYEGY